MLKKFRKCAIIDGIYRGISMNIKGNDIYYEHVKNFQYPSNKLKSRTGTVKINEIKRDEPTTGAMNIRKITTERYYEILLIVSELKTAYERENDDKDYLPSLMHRYESILRRVQSVKEKGFIILNKNKEYLTNEEIALIIVLFTDPKLEYLKDHNDCIKNNLNYEEYLTTKYYCYSKMLILMEAHTELLKNRIEKEQNRGEEENGKLSLGK